MCLLLILLGIMLVRNSVVCNVRTELLNSDYSNYKLLPSYVPVDYADYSIILKSLCGRGRN
ncbi:MAG: hypothetical protein GOVbin2917_152 [Prokaryotic dsDNA virus sp.]|jgi:hypothetical protein|nr:MAG: hypothetical protein GOVbin2917_152 [Prokaryotic dsDNA virus sp.]